MENEVVRKAIEEWKNLDSRDHEAHLAFSRKIHMAEAMGVITKEELAEIKQKIDEIKVENTRKAMREDTRNLTLASMKAAEHLVRSCFGM